jgi:hypothetical protein
MCFSTHQCRLFLHFMACVQLFPWCSSSDIFSHVNWCYIIYTSGFRYLKGQLGIISVDSKNLSQSPPTFTLHQLENALANMTVIIFWSGRPLFVEIVSYLNCVLLVAVHAKPDNLHDIIGGDSKSGATVSQLVLAGIAPKDEHPCVIHSFRFLWSVPLYY